MKVKVQAHVAYQTRYHVVWIPKFRKKVLVSGVKEYLEKTIQTTIVDRYPDVYVIELNVQVDHVRSICGLMDFMSVPLTMMSIRFEITFGIKISRRAVKLCLQQARYHGL